MKIIFLFIDGFGIGQDDKSKNPVIAANTPNIDYMFGRYEVVKTDASLGIPGLPQSATGQTAIFTGINASKVLGRHLSGQPTITLKKIIYKNNLFAELLKRGLKVTNSNVYREEYLRNMLDPRDRRNRPSVTSVMTRSNGIEFRRVKDYNNGKGIYHDITGKILSQSGYDVKIISPEEAAVRLYDISRDYDFTLFEHFMTDIIGHRTDMGAAIEEIELLDAFLGALIKLLDPENDLLFITSDHGNIEDISVKTHTFNKVPTILIGKVPEGVLGSISSLLDITPSVLKIFDKVGSSISNKGDSND